MIEFGKALREAREARGLTVEQLAETTRLMKSAIVDLENETFDHIPAPIYGRGFVKLYCEAVGIDAKPFVHEFMEIYNGNRQPIVHERTVTPPVAPIDVPPPEPVVENPVAPTEVKVPEKEESVRTATPAPAPRPANYVETEFSLFDTPESTREPETPPPVVKFPQEPSEAAPVDEPTPAPKTSERFARYASPVHDFVPRKMPPAVWRVALVAAIALLALWAVTLGVRALYRATSNTAENASSSQTPTTEQPVASSKTSPTPETQEANSRRVPCKVAPLYID